MLKIQSYFKVMVNLIDHHKGEGVLEDHLKSLHHSTNLPNVEYVPFDFHAECPSLNWDKLYALIRKLRPLQSSQSFFVVVRL